MQGVEGEKCDHCPYRWVFVPEYGCHGCDTCTHYLLDSTDELDNLINPVINEFDVSIIDLFEDVLTFKYTF